MISLDMLMPMLVINRLIPVNENIEKILKILNTYFVNVRVFSNISLLTAKRLHLHSYTEILLAKNFNKYGYAYSLKIFLSKFCIQ